MISYHRLVRTFPSGGFLFQESNFTKYLNNSERAVEYFYAFKIYQSINALEKSLREDVNDRFGTSAYGQAIRYGRFAVTSVCVKNYIKVLTH